MKFDGIKSYIKDLEEEETAAAAPAAAQEIEPGATEPTETEGPAAQEINPVVIPFKKTVKDVVEVIEEETAAAAPAVIAPGFFLLIRL